MGRSLTSHKPQSVTAAAVIFDRLELLVPTENNHIFFRIFLNAVLPTSFLLNTVTKESMSKRMWLRIRAGSLHSIVLYGIVLLYGIYAGNFTIS